jgi:hypothetical protein
MNDAGYLLIFASRLFEVFGFLMALLFIFKGVALKYVFITAGLTVSGILISLFGFVSGKISAIQSFAIEAVFAPSYTCLGFLCLYGKAGRKAQTSKATAKGHQMSSMHGLCQRGPLLRGTGGKGPVLF